MLLVLTLSFTVGTVAVSSNTSDGLQSHRLRLAGQTRLKRRQTDHSVTAPLSALVKVLSQRERRVCRRVWKEILQLNNN